MVKVYVEVRRTSGAESGKRSEASQRTNDLYQNEALYDQDIRGLLEVYLGQTDTEFIRDKDEKPTSKVGMKDCSFDADQDISLTDQEEPVAKYRLSVSIEDCGVTAGFSKECEDCGVTAGLSRESKDCGVTARFLKREKEGFDNTASVNYEKSIGNPLREERNALKLAVYKVLEKSFGRSLPWGDLIGVRPVKLAVMMEKEGLSLEQTKARLIRDYGISPAKGELAAKVAAKELDCVKGLTGNDRYSLYIGIPFCPTRCLYCSFTSYPVKGNEDMIEPYLSALKKEIAAAAGKCKGKKPVSIYMGGGTPSSIPADRLYDLITYIKDKFAVGDDTEFTVEAGRPDSIDKEKLIVLKTAGINRISINPQTMKDETLRLMGRTHTFADIEKCYEMAVSTGISNINMDLIMGLPGESVEDAYMSIKKVTDLRPAGITVHTLALKKNSPLTLGLPEYKNKLVSETVIEEMVENSRQMLAMCGYEEYYVYRQKNIGANLENTGYALSGSECLYNILMMEELQTIIACGAGVITKLVYDTENMGLLGNKSIRRIDNLKNLKEYIERIDDVILRKDILDSLWMKDMLD